ncbi:MAG: hypothetical protein PVG66_08875 [Chromatiales bacterium]|jgi:hypothetical protein
MSDGKTDKQQEADDVVIEDVEAAEGDESTLDYTWESAADEVSSPQASEEYDPRPQEDTARRTIAYLLIGLLWVVIAGIFILLAFKSISITEIEEFAVLLGPVVTLVSAATGFYYGTKSS